MSATTAEPTTVAADDASMLETASELRVLVAKLRRRLAEQSDATDFTPSQTAVMSRLLNDGPATLTALARAEAMRPQSMSAIIAALQSQGIVEGTPDPDDGRRTILTLTPDARARSERARVMKNDWLFRSIQAKYTTAEQAQLTHSVELLKRLLEP
jgi:DNA-binding MarR family transcriptional regulator